MSDPIARSLAAAPSRQTVDEWARTTREGRMLVTMRKLTEPQREAWLQCLRRIVDGVPVREAGLDMYRECGIGEDEAEELWERAVGNGA